MYQNVPLFFIGQTTPLTKLFTLFFYFPPILNRQTTPFTKLPPLFLLSSSLTKLPPYFLLPPVFPFPLINFSYFSIYTINKTFSLEGKKPKMEGKRKYMFYVLERPEPKTGGKLSRILIPDLGEIEATAYSFNHAM